MSVFFHELPFGIYLYRTQYDRSRRDKYFAISSHDILDTESELFEIEGLHEIIIGSERKSLDLICLL